MHAEKKSIKSLRSTQDRLIDKQENILKELAIFYESSNFENQQGCEKIVLILYEHYRYQVLIRQNCPNVKTYN